jgi:ADP-heptose:LPS heptosyltransferase
MQILCLDSSLPKDDCPAKTYIGKPDGSGLVVKGKEVIRAWIYRLISGRPRSRVLPIPDRPKCVLVATGGNLGGAIISIPLIEGVRKRWPDCHLAIVGNRQHSLDIIRKAGLGDSFHLAPELPLKDLFWRKEYRRFRREILSIYPEVFISNHNFGLNHVLPLRNISVTIGHVNLSPFSADLKLLENIFDYKIRYEPNTNWLQSYWDLLKAIDIDEQKLPVIQVTEVERRIAKDSLRKMGLAKDVRVVGIQASVWQQQLYKAWPVTSMAELCAKLWSDQGIMPLIIGTKEQDQLASYLRKNHPTAVFVDCVGRFSVAELPGVVALCEAAVTNDSGLMHLSAAVGTPTLALYGMTNPDITWVYGADPKHRIIRRSDCVPCYGWSPLAESCPSRDCLKHISPSTVLKELQKMLKISADNETGVMNAG